MKRAAGFAVVYLLVGAVLNVLVAWGFAVRGDTTITSTAPASSRGVWRPWAVVGPPIRPLTEWTIAVPDHWPPPSGIVMMEMSRHIGCERLMVMNIQPHKSG